MKSTLIYLTTNLLKTNYCKLKFLKRFEIKTDFLESYLVLIINSTIGKSQTKGKNVQEILKSNFLHIAY